MDGNQDLALVAIGTSNSKILRASLKLTKDKSTSIVHRKRLTFLTEQMVHPDIYCGSDSAGTSGVYDIAIQKTAQSVIVSGQSCLIAIDQVATCAVFSCQSACASSGMPMCYWNGDSRACQARISRHSRKHADKNQVSHEYFNPCASESGALFTTVRPSTTSTEPTTPLVVKPSYEKPIKFDTVEETPDMSMSRDPEGETAEETGNHWVTTVTTLAVALVVGLALGAIATISCYKYRTRNRTGKGGSDPIRDYDSSQIEVSEPILPFREPRKSERIGSLYENIRLESNSSDSSRDSGIRMSGDSNPDAENPLPSSNRIEHEFHAHTTGRINRQRPDQLPLKPRLNYSTLTTYTPANHFGSMKYSTTARGSSARTLSTGQVQPTGHPTGHPKLGVNSIHYATMQPKYNRSTTEVRPKYNRTESCPNGQRKPIMPVSICPN